MTKPDFRPVNFPGKDVETVVGSLSIVPGNDRYKKVLVKLSVKDVSIQLTEEQLDAICHWAKNSPYEDKPKSMLDKIIGDRVEEYVWDDSVELTAEQFEALAFDND